MFGIWTKQDLIDHKPFTLLPQCYPIYCSLLESAKNLAKRLGYGGVYISTTILGDHLLRNGWRWIGDAHFLNDEYGSIYVFDLPAPR